ncbi:MAG TPA: two-component regulator propeller domain-containing protein, partial [Flavobacteriales bacterium]|nr:two-component regulator propeller domain-containing protein [Flavobacteriales bacterium]
MDLKPFFLAVFALILPCVFLNAQDLNYYHYTVDDGLPSSQVDDIVQDNYGNLWFSTDHGLSRYNGYEFKNYTIADGLPSNSIFKFFKQPNGEIWATTFSKKVFIIQGKNPVFKPYPYNGVLASVPDPCITICMHVTKNNSLLMSFVNRPGYIHIDEKGKIISNTVEHSFGLNRTAVV